MASLNPFGSGPPDDWATYRRYPYLLARLAFVLGVLGLVYLVLRQAAGVISMIFMGTLLAYVLDPVVDWMERLKIPRSLGILLLLVFAVAFTVVFAIWMIPTIAKEFSEVGDKLEGLVRTKPTVITAWISDTFGFSLPEDTIEQARAKLQDALPSILAYVGDFLRGAAARTMGVVGWLLNIVMIPVFAFYFLRDFDKMREWVVDQIPLAHRDAIVSRGRRIDTIVGDWLRGQVQVALMLAVLYAVGLAIVGIPIAIPIGILSGLLNIVPYLGFAFGFGLAMLMAVLDWHGLGPIVGVGAVFAVAQVLESYVLTPRIVGEKVGLSPVTVIIVLLLGGELFGLLGFMLAVPVAGALKMILLELLDWYRASEMYLGTVPVPSPVPEDSGPP